MASNIFLAITITFMYAAPLILTALGGVVSERSGVINIGLEGMMVIGAFAGAAAGYYSASPWIGFLAAGLAGGLLALLHAVASITFKANQTISGVALNFIGQGLALFLCRLFFDGATMSKPVPKQMPKLMSLLGLQPEGALRNFDVDITFVIALVLTGVIWFVLYRTKWGLRLRAVGEHPAAADTLGVNVYAVRYAAVIISGVLAGFGGAAQSLAVVSLFTPTVISASGLPMEHSWPVWSLPLRRHWWLCSAAAAPAFRPSCCPCCPMCSQSWYWCCLSARLWLPRQTVSPMRRVPGKIQVFVYEQPSVVSHVPGGCSGLSKS